MSYKRYTSYKGCIVALMFLAALGSAAASAAPPKASEEAPKSIFILPTSKQEGRDPFFPDRVVWHATAPNGTNRPPIQAVTLVLNGISGSLEHRLCMINGQTFGKDDEADVKTLDGRKVKVRCLEIRDDSAVVEVEGQRRELHLRRG